jgi:hypothetical protein
VGCPLVGAAIDKEVEQPSYLYIILERVSEVGVRAELILVPSSDRLVSEIASCFQLGNESLGGSLRDPYLVSNIPQTYSWSLGNQDEDTGMVRQECPCSGVVIGHSRHSSAFAYWSMLLMIMINASIDGSLQSVQQMDPRWSWIVRQLCP